MHEGLVQNRVTSRPAGSEVSRIVRSFILAMLVVAMAPSCSRAAMSFDRLKAYVRRNPGNLKAVYVLGKRYAIRKDYDRAIRLWKHILRQRSTVWSVYNRIGLAYYKLGEWEQAIKVFKYILQRDAENRFARKALAVIHKKLMNKDLRRAAPGSPEGGKQAEGTVDKEKGEAGFNEGMSLFYSKKYTKAMARFELALENQVRVPECYYYIATCKLREAEDLKGAIIHYEKCLDMKPDDPKCFMGLAYAYGVMGDVDKQIEYFENVLAQEASSGEAHFQLSMAYDKTDNAPKTFEHAQRAIKLDPSYKKKLQPLIKNSNVARKIGKIITDVLEDTENSQLTDGQIERYAEKIGKILGESNVRTDLTSEEGKRKIRNLVGDPIKKRRFLEAYRTRNAEDMKDIFRESDIDVDVDSALKKARKRGRW